MDAERVRAVVLEAICTDDWLCERLELKGGSALALVYDVGGRSSLDLDFSIEGDFESVREAASRLETSLAQRFQALRHTVFDFRFESQPARPRSCGPLFNSTTAIP